MVTINNNREPPKSLFDDIFTKKIKTPRFINFTDLVETSLLIITMYLGAILQEILMTHSR